MARNQSDTQFIENTTIPVDGAIQNVTNQIDARQTAIQIQDEGVDVGIAGYVETLNFTGSAVTVTDNGSHVVQVAVTGGSGSGLTQPQVLARNLGC